MGVGNGEKTLLPIPTPRSPLSTPHSHQRLVVGADQRHRPLLSQDAPVPPTDDQQRGHGNAQEDSDHSAQLGAAQNRQDHYDRMNLDAAADQSREDDVI